jgi:hypothetical protein
LLFAISTIGNPAWPIGAGYMIVDDAGYMVVNELALTPAHRTQSKQQAR